MPNLPNLRHVGSGASPQPRPAPTDEDPVPEPVFELGRDDPAVRHAVYFITDEAADLLYVGTTMRLIDRLQEHVLRSDWFDTSCRVYVEWYRTARQAQMREAEAIFTQEPRHNRRQEPWDGSTPPADVPARLLSDLDRDVPAGCRNCGSVRVHARRLCMGCYMYRRRNGVDRPPSLFLRHHAA